jgi:hypothetical protein
MGRPGMFPGMVRPRRVWLDRAPRLPYPSTAMEFIRSKPEQLADYLRQRIERGDLVEPLPNIRDWSAQLGVAHGTLETALGILKRQGVIRTRPRKGVHITRPATKPRQLHQPPTVRWLFYGGHYRNVPTISELITALTQRLAPHGIRFSLELCNASRLRAIHQQGERPHEMLILSSMTSPYQEMFAAFRRSVLLVGPPLPGVELPFITNVLTREETDAMKAMRLRYMTARAEREETRLAQERGELLNTADVTRSIVAMLDRSKTILLTVPNVLGALHGVQVEADARREIIKALSLLSVE